MLIFHSVQHFGDKLLQLYAIYHWKKVKNFTICKHNEKLGQGVGQKHLGRARVKLKFGVRGNLGHLISNLNSRMQYRFKIGYYSNNEWLVFNLLISKDTIDDCLKMT